MAASQRTAVQNSAARHSAAQHSATPHLARHQLPPPPLRQRPAPARAATAIPIAAGFAVVCASTALSGVLQGGSWLFYLMITVGLIVAVGIVLRALRVPVPAVGIGQLFALLCVLVMAFTTSGLLFVLPSPAALGDLLGVLHQAIVEVQTKASPVDADSAMVCLVLVAIGLVTIVVDTLAVAAEAPAASGLVLLCVFAVPASLADDLLPWWSFVLGTTSFAVLLVVDGRERHMAWRGGRGGLFDDSREATNRQAVVVVGVAVVLALVAGGTLTFIGTVGKLPGGTGGSGSASSLGIKPFTKLSGLLQENQGNKQLFLVHGLPASSYLRAVTLDEYTPNDGWKIGHDIAGGVRLDSNQLPEAGAIGATTEIQIDPVGWADRWVPVYGVPRGLSNLGDNWSYDPVTGTANTPASRQAGSYVEHAQLAQPSADQLRADGSVTSGQVDARYLTPVQVSTRVRELVSTLTSHDTTTFDKAAALTKYFNGGTNGFQYNLDATPKDASIDQLDDFLFNTRSGFCEQYASAMAVMLRSIGVPTRVAIGFTPGVQASTSSGRSILASDAHAWVEVHFPTYGWVTFDPTPLSGGRGLTPPYLQNSQTQGGSGGLPSGSNAAGPSGSPKPSAGSAPSSAPSTAATGRSDSGDSHTLLTWLLIGVVVLALLLSFVSWVLVQLGLVPLSLAGVRIGRPPLPDPIVRAAHRLPARLVRLVPPLTIGSWALAVVLVFTYVSLWLAVPLLLLGLLGTPAVVRELRRRYRLSRVSTLAADAPSAAWDELLAESRDRGSVIPSTDTVRTIARMLAKEHGLDETGRLALSQVINAVEGSWYGARAEVDPELVEAVEQLRASLHRSAPLALRARVLPRSVLGR